MSMCFNRRVLVGLGVAGAALIAVSAFTDIRLAGILPLLLVLACPLSMVAMMAGMRGMGRSGDDPAVAPATDSDDPEIVRLRVEVAEFRAERSPALPPPVSAADHR